MTGSRALRQELAAYSRLLWERGWVGNHDGNITVKDGATLLATPTATSKRLVTDRSLVEVDLAGKVRGSGKVFGEIGLHTAVYERRPDVGAVVHAHPPNATAIACGRDNPLHQPFIAEAVVSLGPSVPKVPFAAPGDPARAALAPWCELVDAVLLANHGVLAWGACLEQAFLRLELVEHVAKIAVAAAPLGGVVALSDDAVVPLLAARARAGIGRAADRAVELAGKLIPRAALVDGSSSRPVVACAPAPHSPVATMAHGRPQTSDLARVVREEVLRVLKE